MLPIKEAIESSLVYMLISRRQQKYRLWHDSKTWSSCLLLSKLLLQQSQQVESFSDKKKKNLQRQPQECMWSRGGSNVARGPRGSFMCSFSTEEYSRQHSTAQPGRVCWKGRVAAVCPFAVSGSPQWLRWKQEGMWHSCLTKYHHFQIPLLISALLPCC